MRNLSLEGKIVIFKIKISKIVFQTVTTVPKHTLKKYKRLLCGKTLLGRESMKLSMATKLDG